MQNKVFVIGAGIAGIMSAYFLNKKGYNVTVFDKNVQPAMECSFANGGQISVCNSEVWNTVSNLKKGLKWMFKKDAPLYIHPKPSIEKLVWLGGFLRHTFNLSHDQNTLMTIRMGVASRKYYNQVLDDVKIEYGERRRGILHVYKDKESLQKTTKLQDLFRLSGCGWEYIGRDLSNIDPTLANTSFVGGIYTEDDWSGDIHQFCNNMAKVLKERGVNFIFNKEVSIDDVESLSLNGKVILCNGVELKKFAANFGNFLNMYPVKGYSISIPLDESSKKYAPTVSLLDDDAKIVCSNFGNVLRVAGTAELAGYDTTVVQSRIDPLLNWVQNNFPNINTNNYSSWACLRPMMADMLPIVMRSKFNSNVFYHGGHGHLGWTLAAFTGKELADIL